MGTVPFLSGENWDSPRQVVALSHCGIRECPGGDSNSHPLRDKILSPQKAQTPQKTLFFPRKTGFVSLHVLGNRVVGGSLGNIFGNTSSQWRRIVGRATARNIRRPPGRLDATGRCRGPIDLRADARPHVAQQRRGPARPSRRNPPTPGAPRRSGKKTAPLGDPGSGNLLVQGDNLLAPEGPVAVLRRPGQVHLYRPAFQHRRTRLGSTTIMSTARKFGNGWARPSGSRSGRPITP